MVDVITGATRADSVLQSGLVVDMEAKSARLEEGSYLFETLTRKVGLGDSRANGKGLVVATRMKHDFRERRVMPATVLVTTAAAAAATTIAVDHPEYFHRDELVYCPDTGEMFIMNEDTGGTGTAGSITVLNKIGTGGITNAISAGARLVRLTESHAEGEAIPPATNIKETELTTYLYQFDETTQVTDVLNAEENYGEKELLKRRKDAWITLKKGLNLMMYLAQNNREVVSASGPRRHSMRGIREWLNSYAIDATQIAGGITLKSLGILVRPTMSYDSSSPTKICISGSNGWQSISSFPEGAVRVNPGKDQKWGITLKELNTAFGDIMVSYDPMLTDEYDLAGELYILDPKHIRQMEMRDLPLVMHLNCQDNTDKHNIKDLITGTRGLEVKLGELHRRVYNIS